MGNKSKIEWTDATWNPVTGCTKISAGCDNCYAERMAKRLQAMGQANYRDGFAVRYHPDMLEIPFRWKRPRRIFVCSMGDLFHPEVPFHFIAAVFGVMAANPHHCYQVLSKRPERMLEFFTRLNRSQYSASLECADALLVEEANNHPDEDQGPIHCKFGPAPDAPWPLSNVWLGVTAENQKMADERIPILLSIPAAVRFVSIEPMLGPISLAGFDGVTYRPWLDTLAWKAAFDQIIIGGESGPGARPMNPDWVRSVRDQCIRAKVPFFFKQWGGGKKNGRLLDGRTWDEMPRPLPDWSHPEKIRG